MLSKRRTRNPFAGHLLAYGPSINTVGDEAERPPVSLAKVTLPEGIEDNTGRFLQFRTIKLGYEAWQAIEKAGSFEAWCRIGAALSIGKAEALRTTGANRAAGQYYCQAFHRWDRGSRVRHNATLRPEPRHRITRTPSRDHRMA